MSNKFFILSLSDLTDGLFPSDTRGNSYSAKASFLPYSRTVFYDVFIIIYVLINNTHSNTTQEELPKGIKYMDVRFHCPF